MTRARVRIGDISLGPELQCWLITDGLLLPLDVWQVNAALMVSVDTLPQLCHCCALHSVCKSTALEHTAEEPCEQQSTRTVMDETWE